MSTSVSGPDPTQAAELQAKSSKEVTNAQTIANRPDMYTPWGNMTWDQQVGTDPATGAPVTNWTGHLALNADQQASLDAQNKAQLGRSLAAQDLTGAARDELTRPMDWGGLPEAGGEVAGGPLSQLGRRGSVQGDLDYSGAPALGDPSQIRQRAEDALYNRSIARLDPQWGQRESELRTQLANQGVDPGSDAYNQLYGNFSRGRNDAYSSAMNDAISGGGAEAQRQFGMDLAARQQGVNEVNQQGAFHNAAQAQDFGQDLQAAQFGNAAQAQQFGQGLQASQYETQRRQQALAEEQQRRTLSLNLMNAALTGQQVEQPNMPGFNQAGAAQATQYLQANQQAQQQAQMQNQFMSDMVGGITQGGASAAMMFSDERLKEDIRRLPFEALPGVPYAAWRWKTGGRGFGVIAQDLEKVRPDLVIERNGFKMVDYGGLP
jgi:surface antigen